MTYAIWGARPDNQSQIKIAMFDCPRLAANAFTALKKSMVETMDLVSDDNGCERIIDTYTAF